MMSPDTSPNPTSSTPQESTKTTQPHPQAGKSSDIAQWDDLARGKSFAMIHHGAIVYGREERDRKSWAAKINPKKADVAPELMADEPRALVGGTAQDLGPRRGDAQPGSTLDQLDQCMADLKNNHQKLAQYTEKSIRYLWQETKNLLAQHDSELKERQATLDQLALQNRSLKADNKALLDRWDDDRKPRGPAIG